LNKVAAARDLFLYVIVKSYDGRGAGFYISEKHVVTNQHVVGNSTFVEVQDYLGNVFSGKILAINRDADLALISVSQEGRPLILARHGVKLGVSTQAIGHPNGLDYTLTSGVVSAIRQINLNSNSHRTVKVIQTDTPISPGSSGGPLLVKGEVVGVNTAKNSGQLLEGLGFAVHADEVQDFVSQVLERMPD